MKNVFSGLGAQVAGLCIGLATTPLIVRGLGGENYGMLSLVLGIGVWFSFVNMVVLTTTIRYVGNALGRDARDEAGTIFSAFLFWSAAGAMLVAALLFALAKPIADALLDPPAAATAAASLRVFAVFTFFEILLAVPRGVLWSFHRLGTFYLLRTAALGTQSLGWAALASRGRGVPELLAWSVAVMLAEWLCTLALSARCSRLSGWTPQELRLWGGRLLNYGGRLLPGYASVQLMLPASQILLGAFRAPVEIAHFTIPANLVRYVRAGATQISTAILPAASEASGEEDETRLRYLYLKGLRWSWFILAPFACLAIAFGPSFIGAWIAPEFGAAAHPLMAPLVIGLAVYFLGGTPMVLAQGTGRPGLWSRSCFYGGIANVLLGLWWIPARGAAGAAQALAAGGCLSTLMLMAWATRRFSVSLRDYGNALDLRLLAAAALISLALRAAPWQPGSPWAIIAVCLAAVAAVAAYAARFVLDPEERGWIGRRFALLTGRSGS